MGPALLPAALLLGFDAGSGLLEEEITPCPVQMKDGGTTYPGLTGAGAQRVLFAYLQFFKNNIIHQQISKHFTEERGSVSSALFSVGGETEAQRKCQELQASSAALLSHLDEATSQGPAVVQATSQAVLKQFV